MNGKKTYLVSALMLLHGLGSYALGFEPQVNVSEILLASGLAALRSGIKKAERPESEPATPAPTNPFRAAPLLCGLCVLGVSPLQAQFGTPTSPLDGFPTNWSWTAPNPPLPGTTWYDYGWDSPSNGPVPAEVHQAAVGVHRERAPMRQVRNAAAATWWTAPDAPDPLDQPVDSLTYVAPNTGRVYFDSGLQLITPDFDEVGYGYGVRLGYQVSKHWAIDFGASHHGLDYDGSAIQDLSGRLVARMPFSFLSPYTFLGGRFDLQRDVWTIEPGAGIELGVSKKLRGLSIYAEGNLRADTEGHNAYGFGAGVRVRF